ncbi:MAG: hypothetical protein VX498_06610 [Myxococcota bacterium]|nr:hypothetical protein [Myxococcota bacterium]
MKIRMMSDGRELSGNPTEIVQTMQGLAFGKEDLSLGDYAEWCASMARDLLKVPLVVEGSSDEEKTTSLVTGMLALGLAEELPEELLN